MTAHTKAEYSSGPPAREGTASSALLPVWRRSPAASRRWSCAGRDRHRGPGGITGRYPLLHVRMGLPRGRPSGGDSSRGALSTRVPKLQPAGRLPVPPNAGLPAAIGRHLLRGPHSDPQSTSASGSASTAASTSDLHDHLTPCYPGLTPGGHHRVASTLDFNGCCAITYGHPLPGFFLATPYTRAGFH